MTERIGVLIRTYDRYKDNLDPLVTGLKEAGLYTVVVYDVVKELPEQDVIDKCDFFIPHAERGNLWQRKQDGAVYQQYKGLQIMYEEGYDYAFTIAGGAIIKKPENVPSFIEIMGDNDLIASKWWNEVGTLLMFGKTEALYRVYCDVPYGLPQFEKKTTKAVFRNSIKYTLYRCSEEDRGIWGAIGFARQNGNYEPKGMPPG